MLFDLLTFDTHPLFFSTKNDGITKKNTKITRISMRAHTMIEVEKKFTHVNMVSSTVSRSLLVKIPSGRIHR